VAGLILDRLVELFFAAERLPLQVRVSVGNLITTMTKPETDIQGSLEDLVRLPPMYTTSGQQPVDMRMLVSPLSQAEKALWKFKDLEQKPLAVDEAHSAESEALDEADTQEIQVVQRIHLFIKQMYVYLPLLARRRRRRRRKRRKKKGEPDGVEH